MSQNTRIRAALLAGKKLSPLTALRDFNCMRLASRISEIRAGFTTYNTVTRPPRFGEKGRQTERVATHYPPLEIIVKMRKQSNGKRFAVYYAAPEAIEEAQGK